MGEKNEGNKNTILQKSDEKVEDSRVMLEAEEEAKGVEIEIFGKSVYE